MKDAGPEGRDFWDFLDALLQDSRVVIERRKGTPHPRYPELEYPFDYGFLEGTASMDAGGIDVWRGSLPKPSLDAVIAAVDLEKRDAEIKLLLGCSQAEQAIIVKFHNSGAQRATLIRRAGVDLLLTRRSVRRFLPDPVPRPVVERLLQAATWAPSAHNRQPWRFAVLETLEAKERLADGMGVEFRRDLLSDGLAPAEVDQQVERSRTRILEAPVVVVLCLDPTLGDTYPDPARQQAEYLMGVQGVAMAGQNLLLAAHAEHLGGVWTCAPLFAPEAVRRALRLPQSWHPQGLLLLGYPAKILSPRPRQPIEEVARFL